MAVKVLAPRPSPTPIQPHSAAEKLCSLKWDGLVCKSKFCHFQPNAHVRDTVPTSWVLSWGLWDIIWDTGMAWCLVRKKLTHRSHYPWLVDSVPVYANSLFFSFFYVEKGGRRERTRKMERKGEKRNNWECEWTWESACWFKTATETVCWQAFSTRQIGSAFKDLQFLGLFLEMSHTSKGGCSGVFLPAFTCCRDASPAWSTHSLGPAGPAWLELAKNQVHQK